jgi:hypothetical protein
VTNTIVFPVNSALLNGAQRAELDSAAAAWNSRGATGTVSVDGYASAEGPCDNNWILSCRRARAVADELQRPINGAKGVPAGNISLFAHGESLEAGPALEPNRRVTVSIPGAPSPTAPAPSEPVAPAPSGPPPAPSTECTLPRILGVGRTNCGKGTDFTHFDFPTLSAKDAAALSAWALTRPPHSTDHTRVSDADCESEMDSILTKLAGSAGHDAFLRFKSGVGGTEHLGPGTQLGKDALGSGSFGKTVAAVKSDIEKQLAAQAPSGKLDPCLLKVIPPQTNFDPLDSMALQAVIGGTHGESLKANSFTGDAKARTYSIDLEFFICDNFGVDDHDMYFWGLFPFWVLQHERSATLYAPFINELDLSLTVSGTF